MSKPVRLVFLADDSQLTSALRRMVGQTSAAQAALRSLEKTGADMHRVGRSITMGFTAPVLAAATGAVMLASKFDETMLHIQTLAGVSAEQMQQWSAQLLKLGPALGKTPQELADGLLFVASSGIDAGQAIDVLTASAKASADGLGTTQSVADFATSAVNAYGISNLSAAKAVDILLRAVKDGKAEPAAFAQEIGQVIPLAAEMGVSFDQVAGAMAALTLTGANAAKASTQLHNVFAEILRPSKGVSIELDKIGLSSKKLQEELKQKGLLAALEDLKARTGGNSEQFAKLFPNIRGLLGVLSLVGPNGEKAAAVMKDVAASGGDVNAAFELQKQQPLFKFKEALSSIAATGIDIGNKLAPSAARAAEALSHLVEKFANLNPKTQDLIFKIVGLVAALGPLLFVGGSTIKIFTQLARHPILTAIALLVIGFITAYNSSKSFHDGVNKVVHVLMEGARWIQQHKVLVESLASSFGTFIAVSKISSLVSTLQYFHLTGIRALGGLLSPTRLFSGAIVGLKSAFGAVRVAWLALSSSFLASPLGIVIALIAALAIGFYIAYTHSATFRKIVHEALHAVAVAAKWAWDGIVAGAKAVWGWIGGPLTTVFHIWWNTMKAIFNAVMPVLRPVINFFKTIANIIGDAIGTAVVWVRKHWDTIKKILLVAAAVVFAPILLAIGAVWLAWKFLSTVVPPVLKFLWDIVSAVFKQWWSVVSGTMSMILSVVTPVFHVIWAVVSWFAGVAWALFSGFWSLISALFMAGLRILLIVWEVSWNTASLVIKAVWTFIRDLMVSIVTWVVDKFQWLYDKMAPILKVTWAVVRDMFEQVREAIAGPMNAVKEFLGRIWDWIYDKVSGVAQRVHDAVSGWFNKIKSSAESSFTGIGQAMRNGVNAMIRLANNLKIPPVKLAGQTVFEGWDGPNIPYLANGAIVNQPTLAMIGEAGSELVLPLTRKQRALELLQQSGLLGDLPAARGGSTAAQPTAQRGSGGVTIQNLTVYSQATDTNGIGRDIAWQIRGLLA